MQHILKEKQIGIYALLFGVMFLLSVGFVFAQEEDGNGNEDNERSTPAQVEERRAERQISQEERQVAQEVRQEEREVRQVERQVVQEERESARIERRNERIRAYTERVVKRFNAVITRLTRLADRMESRIEKLEAREFDLSIARELLGDARIEIANTQESIAAIDTSLEDTLASDNPKEAFSAVRGLISESKESIKIAHRALVDAIREIKAGIGVHPEGDDDNTATTTDNGEEVEENNGETE